MCYLLVFLLVLILTAYLPRYTFFCKIIDIPNLRSSHANPTPRGGGLVFVSVFLGSMLGAVYLGMEFSAAAKALISAGLLVAIIGLIDDCCGLPVSWRIVAHLGASVLVLYLLGGMPAISILNIVVPVGFALNLCALIYLVWQLNLYNFMDGIDGLAAIEAISVCLGAVLLYNLNGNYDLMYLPLLLSAAVAGFLCWNFAPARIFMGDTGSGFLGLALGVFSIQAANVNPRFFWCWLILLGVFIVDASTSLLCRLFQAKKIYEAHCDHAYQHAARHYASHARVSLGVLTLNIFWLLPLAILVSKGFLSGFVGLILAYAPIFILALSFKAGYSVNSI